MDFILNVSNNIQHFGIETLFICVFNMTCALLTFLKEVIATGAKDIKIKDR